MRVVASRSAIGGAEASFHEVSVVADQSAVVENSATDANVRRMEPVAIVGRSPRVY